MPPKKKTSPVLIGVLACGGLFILVVIIGAVAGGSKDKNAAVTTVTTAAPSVNSGTPTDPAPTTVVTEVPVTSPATTSAPAPTENVIGTPVNEDGVIFTVTAVTDPAPPGQFDTLDAGDRLVSLEITAQNTKAENEVVSSLMCFSLKSDDGTAGEMSIFGTETSSPNLDGNLLPGESLKGSLTFKIPTTAKGLYLKINCGITGGSVIQLHAAT